MVVILQITTSLIWQLAIGILVSNASLARVVGSGGLCVCSLTTEGCGQQVSVRYSSLLHTQWATVIL